MIVETHEFSLPLESPLDTAHGPIEHRKGILIRIDDGDYVGIGEATPLPGWTESLPACRAAIAHVDDPESALSSLESTPAARHGFALALADLWAKREDQPLYRFLGGPDHVESVPANATVGDCSRTETVAAVTDAVDSGFESVKVKVGARSLTDDVSRLRAVRDAVGSDVELRVDANGGWSRAEAREAFHKFDSLRIAYVEQPLPADDIDGLADLRGRSVGVAVDESIAEMSAEAVLDAGAADVLICKPMVIGGPDRVVEVAKRAREEGVTPVVTTTIDGVVARTAAIHAAAAIPDRLACGVATGTLLGRDLGPDRTRLVDGSVSVPQEPGNGVADTWGES
ncbi:o-succinylbenzoate synthase [Haladaptatus sp. AB618]|uniref:mandelate racemase/muconate lactonizing enzyme family protein n=1 Tax=Haladaptatus sp. AB618 TaxID=2934173 RepID=UPI00209C610E|nr:o-succinylbenzoate synthase [Haladaptatus sp. AB618]MCO8254121.1 o-succinylbenzoate synthase [Haladaptatus sp. AB618]